MWEIIILNYMAKIQVQFYVVLVTQPVGFLIEKASGYYVYSKTQNFEAKLKLFINFQTKKKSLWNNLKQSKKSFSQKFILRKTPVVELSVKFFGRLKC